MTREAPSSHPGVAEARLVPLGALTAAEFGAWHALRSANPALDSPYFHPEFAAAVHASGPSVSVVVMRSFAGEISALLPGHRVGRRLYPVGWPGADFQGPVLAPGTKLRPMDLLVDGVREFEFDHLLPQGPGFDPWTIASQSSPYLDTTGGLDGYLARASRSGRDNMGQARRRAAKAERTYGPVRFAADVVDHEVLARVIELKRAQYAATGSRDYFAKPARIDLMHRLLQTRGSGFGGILSTMHIGDQLVAAHFGIRSDHVLHWWFPVYDPAYAQLSPGWILLRELVAATPGLGVLRIDLGRGDDEYKRRAKTGEILVSQGIVTRSSTRRMLRRARHSSINAAKASPAGPVLRQLARRLRGAGLSARATSHT
ncbi:CelD/BcsL family acetyltransferase involved in cellulose biosynthesis [Mycobacterium frederiksbergense]|uniref:CelD/BcsL family acetyltransferase involved in cellulose biosynthesis n=1 Tax=Mycolicibacterium frederiksbergense TaxID=117567 RepID=A0ABT6KZV1_9MYCO|nr:GNAT family N-acetyltransferase [Mycolicibacterium frederiksbergense]MDH6196227.1 CelD/BcsL family acetyltransferase involved in cellulose biosynthesis [Mycolicibacterium frederiksbergense]